MDCGNLLPRLYGGSDGRPVIHDKNKRSPVGRFFFRATDAFGQGELLYTPPALISIIGAYQSSLTTVAWLTMLWTLIAIGRPFERLIAAWKHWQAEKARVITSPTVGIIERIDHPDIVRVRLSRHSSWKPGMLHTAAMSNGDQHYYPESELSDTAAF
ncbi:hypothetical protein, partial [Bradyrhizobium japonicum]|uniref:hypothetical protein n=2 Tax=Bradyrhizobium japonicum TaxID=375 RepID=UPI0012FE4683